MNESDTTSALDGNLLALDSLLTEEKAADIRALAPPEELEIMTTGSGNPTCRAHGVWVYSRHDPKKEADRLISREVPKSTEICLFENFGLGYHIEAFLRAVPRGRAIVLEPDLSWFRAALSARDLRAILGSDRVTLLLDAPPEVIGALLGETGRVHVVRIRSLSKKNPAYFDAVDAQLRSLTARRDINKNTLARFGKRWVRNLIRNIHLVARARGVNQLQNTFSGIPGLVLAAGPSLDEVLPRLAELRERFLLIAVDTSYRAALKTGIVPDFLVVVDPQYWNARHLDGCPVDSTILVSESSTYPSVFHRPVADLFFCGSLFPLGQYLEKRFGEKGMLGAGGSVSTTTWDFARSLGCSPIFCAGLDLGFPFLKTHFRGGFFEERAHAYAKRTDPAETMAFHLLRDAAPYPVANNSGTATLTDKRLVIYKWWFENQLKMRPQALTYNLSRDGVQIEHMPLAPIEELLTYPKARLDIDSRLESIRGGRITGTSSMGENQSELRSAVLELVAELRSLQDAAEAGVRAAGELEQALQDGSDPSPVLSRLDDLDRTIGRLATRDIAGFLVHSTAQSILEGGSAEDGTGDTESRKRAVDNSRKLYGHLREAAAYHIELLERAAGRLETANKSDRSC